MEVSHYVDVQVLAARRSFARILFREDTFSRFHPIDEKQQPSFVLRSISNKMKRYFDFIFPFFGIIFLFMLSIRDRRCKERV